MPLKLTLHAGSASGSSSCARPWVNPVPFSIASSSLSDEEVTDLAEQVWNQVNLVNLRETLHPPEVGPISSWKKAATTWSIGFFSGAPEFRPSTVGRPGQESWVAVGLRWRAWRLRTRQAGTHA